MPPKVSAASVPKPQKYLERPDVMRFMDDIVKKCMLDEPADPGLHIYQYLKTKFEPKTTGNGGVAEATSPNTCPAPPPKPSPGATGFQRKNSGNAAEDAAWAATCTLEHLNRRLELLGSAELGAKIKFPDVPEGQPKHPLLQPLETKLSALATKMADAPAALPPTPLNLSSTEQQEGPPPTPKGITRSLSMGDGTRKTKTDALKEKMANALFNAAQLLNNNSSLEMSPVINSVVNSVRVLLRADRCACFIANEKTRTLESTIEGKDFSLRYGQGIAGHVARTGCSLLIENAYEDKRFDPTVDMELGYTTRDILCLPISVENDLIAVVQLVNKVGGGIFTKDDEQLFVSFAQFAGIKIRNAVLFKEQTRLAMRNKAISEVTETLANTELVESRLIPVIVQNAKGIVGADRCAFFTVDYDRSVIIAHLEGVLEQLELPLDSGIVGHVAKTRQVLNVPKAYDDPRFNKEVDSVSGYQTENILCIPIFVDKKLVAVTQLVNKTLPDGEIVPFNEEDEEVLQAFASVAGVCIRNCRLFENLQHRKKMMETTLEIAKGVGMGDITKPENIMNMVSSTVCDFTSAEICGLFILNNDYSKLSTSRGGPSTMIRAHDHRFVNNPNSETIEFPFPGSSGTAVTDDNIIGECCRSQKPQLYMNVSAERVRHAFGEGFNCKEVYLTPVVVHDEGVGVLALCNKRSLSGFNENDKEMVQLFSTFVAVAIRNSKLILAAQDQVNDWALLMQFERGTGTDEPTSSEATGGGIMSPGSRRSGGFSPIPEPFEREMTRETTDYSIGGEGKAGSVFGGPRCAIWQSVESETVDRLLGIVPDQQSLKTLNSHDFNVHHYLDGLLPADELIPLGIEMFKKLNFFTTFKIKPESLCKFIVMVRSKYRRVPYHNFFHAFDVTQTIYQFIVQGRLSSLLTNTDLLGLLLAGLVHDIDHMGLNNAFHLKAETPMGILTSLTGTKSVLEVHHCQLAVELLGHTNLLGDLEHHERNAVYKTIIDAVLATDMAAHKDICESVERDLVPAVKEHMHRTASSASHSNRPLGGEARRLTVIMLLKMADISNVTKPFNVSRQWGIQVMEEFHAQGTQEKKRGLEVTPMFAEKQELAKSQLGFINFLANPFFTLGVKCFPTLEHLTQGIKKNMQHWEKLLADKQAMACTPRAHSAKSQEVEGSTDDDEEEDDEE